ncbi:MAG: phosphoribosyltransferase [bacterium]
MIPFRDREKAGELLAEHLDHLRGRSPVVLAIPRGGVPVAYPVALRLRAPLDLVIPRKLPIPWNPEAGFGAITADGTLILNRELMNRVGISERIAQDVAREVQREVIRRTEEYRRGRPPADLRGKSVVLIDDGLASGFTMLAAIKSARKQHPASITVAVPVSPRSSANRVRASADDLVALLIQDAWQFAVASFYESFPDLSDSEVIRYLDMAREALESQGGEGGEICSSPLP